MGLARNYALTNSKPQYSITSRCAVNSRWIRQYRERENSNSDPFIYVKRLIRDANRAERPYLAKGQKRKMNRSLQVLKQLEEGQVRGLEGVVGKQFKVAELLDVLHSIKENTVGRLVKLLDSYAKRLQAVADAAQKAEELDLEQQSDFYLREKSEQQIYAEAEREKKRAALVERLSRAKVDADSESEIVDDRPGFMKSFASNIEAIKETSSAKGFNNLYECFVKQAVRSDEFLYLQSTYRNKARLRKADPDKLDEVLQGIFERRSIKMLCNAFEIDPKIGFEYVVAKLAKECPGKEMYEMRKNTDKGTSSSFAEILAQSRSKIPSATSDSVIVDGELDLSPSSMRAFMRRKRKKRQSFFSSDSSKKKK